MASAAPKQPVDNKTDRLGSETIEGVIATGFRYTHTTPVGEVGNDHPLVTTTEVWRSTELEVTVLTKYSDYSDLRTGDQTRWLTNISRTNPEASLFSPPPDYKVIEEKDSFSISFKR